MRILVTGSSGQVVRSIIDRSARSSDEILALGRPDLDLAGEPSDIVSAITAASPDAIVSSAAYTAVDKAENEPDLAFATNARGPGAIAAAARELDVPLVHLSTDYVFDGSSSRPYSEEDPTGPTTVYGASKLAGEEAVLGHENSAVLRTAWVYSPHGSNFVKTMLRVAQARDELRVVADQLGNPTSALDIADAVLTVVRNLRGRDDPGLRGLFHMSGSGEASWAEFAQAIFATSATAGGPTALVTPISTAEYPTPAKRPANSRLDCSKLERVHGLRLPDWRTSLPPVVSDIVARMSKDEEQR
jgi:dTDP-4-dehydrorhamnose reductase